MCLFFPIYTYHTSMLRQVVLHSFTPRRFCLHVVRCAHQTGARFRTQIESAVWLGQSSCPPRSPHNRGVRLLKMCRSDNISVHFECSLNMEEVNNRTAPGDKVGVVRPEDCRLFDPSVMLPCLPSDYHF